MSRKIIFLLGCSLLLNVFLIGILVGYMLQKQPAPRFPFPQRDDAEFLAKLPDEKQALYRDIVGKLNEGGMNFFRDLRQLEERVIDVLTAPEFDADLYLAEEKKVHEFFSSKRKKSIDATIEFAQHLNQAERIALAEYLEGPLGYMLKARPPHSGGPPPWKRKQP